MTEKNKNIEAIYPLSPMQQGMLYHTLYAPASGAYMQQVTCGLKGDLNVVAFESAWQQVINRHPVLRSAFLWRDLDNPLQIVGRTVKLPLQFFDWQTLSATEQQIEIEKLLAAERARGFNLAQAPLMRLFLLQLSPDSYQFIWNRHHILFDGWSVPLVLQEVFAFYEASCRGETLKLEQPRPFRDYIAWLKQQDMSRAEAYWRKALAGFTTPTRLSLEHTGENGYGEEQVRLSVEQSEQVQHFAREQQVTVNTVVQGAWALLLSRYSGEEEVLFGATVSGRPAELAGVEQMVGLFINSLPVRVKVNGAAEVGIWLRELQKQVIELRQYEYSPLVEVQGWSDVKRGQNLFDTLVVFDNFPVGESLERKEGSLEIRDVEVSGNNHLRLTLTAVPSAEFWFLINYDKGHFDAASIRRMLDHLATVVASMCANPRVSEVRLLSDAEEAQVLRQGNEKRAEYEVGASLTELFERQVERAPEATALLWEEQKVSYAELNRRANQLGHYLRRLGLGPESLVALMMERSVEMVVAVLGVLKAGGAYLPVDPAYPEERVRFMLEDAGAAVVLTSGTEFEGGESSGARVVRLDEEWQGIATEPETNLESMTTADNLAYVIYTSGSTGRPKGMMITHRNVLRLFATSARHFHFNADDVWSLFHSYAFDFSVWELWGALLYGGKLLLVKYWESRSPSAFLEQVRETGVTVLNQTPSAFRQLQHAEAEAESTDSLKLRVVIFGGEALELSSLKPWAERHGADAPQLVNMYGITETTVHVTYRRLQASEIENGSGKVIGQALDDLVLYVLDERMQVLPTGVAGEMYVGGAGLGRGYLGRPELTATRFVPDPYSGVAGARLYRTGDVGRYRSNGELEYVGRADEQVKVRGHRIELGEIEAVLQQHEGVREAVVLVRGEAEQQQLVGYVVVAAGVTVTSSELRTALEQRLPEYMIPQAFVMLEQWPLTVNGKLDRNALPEPDGSRPALEKEYVAPRTAVEEVLSGIWSEVLGVAQVGVHDNFFELGGHSLLATQVVSRVREAFRVELPLSDLFEHATIAASAVVIEAGLRGGSELTDEPIRVVPRSEVLQLSFAQQRLWFLDQLEPGSATYNIPIGIRLRGSLDVEALERSISEMVRRHETLRTRFVEEEGTAQQVIEAAEPVKLLVTELGGLEAAEQEEEIGRLANEEARQPFDLEHGPLWRGQLIRLNEAEHVLLFTMHHIISDGWSMGVLVREVSALYEAYVNGGEASLAELPIQYADFAVWQREYLQGAVLERQLGYWRKQLADAPPVLQLPTDHPRPAIQSYRGAQVELQFSAEISAGLKQLSQREGVTLFMTLLAVWQVLLWRYTGQKDVVVGTPIANRQRSEIEGLIGFFVNSLVLRTQLEGKESGRELLRRVREVCLGAYAHQDVPFEMLVDELRPDRDMSHTPLFQVMLVLQNAPVEVMHWPGIEVSGIAVEHRTARFELNVGLGESAQGIVGTVEYNTDLFEQETIERMMGHFERLASALVTDVEQPVSEWSLLSEAEQEQLVEWNNTRRDYGPHRCLHEMIEAQVERSPEAEALVYEGQQLTYAELNRSANQLAHYLQGHGVGPEVLVGILMERSLELVVGLLGVHKAGGAYVPLDPGYPEERLRRMVTDAGIAVVLTQERVAAVLSEPGVPVVCFERDWERIATESEANPQSAVAPENLAYVIHTSGSTGTPKGAMNTHRAIGNRLRWMQERYQLSAADRVLQKTPLSFDVSVWEFFWPLLEGARLVVARPGGHQDPEYLLGLIEREQITTLHFVPSMLQQFLAQSGVAQQCQSVRQVMCSGEALSLELQERYFEVLSAPLHNLYGPTEAAVDVTSWECQRGDRGTSVPIGEPIANVEVYVLDEQMRLAPVGVVGQLYLGGECVGRGYVRQPALTAERFIPHPYSRTGGERLYRTGDEGRYRADGNLEYVGRADQQVKLRGYRIELGEIEAVLSQHEAVQETVVVVPAEAEEQKRLVAYVVSKSEAQPTTSELREFMQQRLPMYMVPSVFMFLEAMPLNANGKLDRKALPAVDGSRPTLDKEFVAPRTPSEEVLATIWTQVLGVEKVGIHDTFFQLGGDSIRSIQVISKARALGFNLSVQQLFQHPTIYELAQMQLENEAETITREPLKAFSLIIEADREALPTDVVDAYPLTRLQAGMLFHGVYDPGAAVYHDILSFHLRAPLELAALRRAVQELAERHPIVRTSFDFANYSEPLQLVHDKVSVPLAVDDLSELCDAEQEEALEAWRAVEKSRPFDWAQAPLLRFQVHRRSVDSFQFTMSCHHAILDGWSVATLFTELFQETFRLMGLGSDDEQVAPASGYNRFVALERETLESAAAQSYWAGQLSELTRTRLSGEQQSEASQPRLLDHEVRLGGELSAGLRKLARAAGVPLKSVLLAAHLRVLSIFSGQRDVLTGLVSNGRAEETDGERVLGLFLNTVPFRVGMQGGSWRELVQQTFRAEQALLPYRRYPLAELQRMAGGGEPLFETAFNFMHFHVYEKLSDVKNVEVLGVNNYALSNFLLTANFSQVLSPPDVQLRLTCNAAILSEAQIANLAECYERCLAAMVNEPAAEYSRQCLLSAAEQQQLLVEWNETKHEYPREGVMELFERQVKRTPEASALWFAGSELSYGELNTRSNQLAHYLKSRGAGPEVLVGVMLERSLELVVAVLGVLKAGAAYVPLEPQQPAVRLQQMIADAGVSVLLTHSSLRAEQQAATVICLDEQWEQISGERESAPRRKANAQQLMYVMYTSGSTGQPKGVMIEQGGVSNYLAWMQVRYPIDTGDRILQTTSIGFDVSVRELFWPLLSGAQVMLPLPGEQQDSARLVELIVDARITHARFVPAMLELFLAESRVTECRSLQRVFCGGEALPRRLQQRFQERLPWVELHNTYGPTEATVNATAWQCEADDARSSVPIGRPLWNTQVYLLDEWQQPVPTGVPGELYLGGVGLARGYHRQAALTAERFVPHPFSGAAGARLYRTGDVGRYLPNGEIEFVGRVDEQVKLRGFRIELGEIEAVLQQHEAVREAVVVLRESGEQKQLVGYVIAAEGMTVTSSELLAYLKERLPDYMVPQAFVALEQWPLTPNGKIARRALPAPEGNRLRSAQQYAAPRTDAEKLLAEIWAEVLRVETVGIHDNFFELGGDSILSIQIVARARRGQLYLTPRDLFQHQTIAELAVAAGSQSVLAEQGEVTGELPLTPIQRWFFAQQLPEQGHFNQAVLLGVRQRVEARLLEPLLAALLEQHDALRLRFRYEDGEWRQRNVSLAESFPPPLTVIDLGAVSDAELAAAVEAEAEAQQRSLDLEHGPLLRLVLFELGAERGQRLLLIVHHLVVDGVSWRILWEDFQRGYEQLAQGEAVDLGPKTTSYRQWAESLVDYAQSDVVREQLGYWEQLLQAGAPPLPVNHPEGENLVQHVESITRRLSVEDTRSLLTEVPALYHTQIQEVLLTALAGAVQRWNTAERVLVNVEGHGREALTGATAETDLTRTVGWFTTIYPVLLATPLGAPIGERLKAVKEQLRRVPERGVGYALLKYLSGELQDMAEAQLSFNYLGQLDQVVSERGWLSGAPESSGTARSPLGTRKYLIEVNGFIAANQLQMNWNYSAALHDAEEIERVADYYFEELRALVEHCRQPGAGGYTPSDFPLAPVSQSQLDELVQQYPRLVDLYPLTPTQQGMLFNTLYRPESQMGIEQMHCRFEGVLDLAALKHAWQQVLARHSVLRTAFAWEDLPQMLQIVQSEVELPWVYHDWRIHAAEQQEQALETFLAADRARGFDPTVAPLLRCTLIQLSDELYYFVWSYHHLLFDGWSMPLLLQELFTLYDDGEAALPPSRPYRDYLAWLAQQRLAEAESYWRTQLAGFTTPTPLPDRTRPADADNFATEHLQLSAEVTASLQQFARGQQLTLNTVVHAAWSLLLSRYSGEDDLLYGVTVSGRPPELPGVEQIVGLFINTLPLRVRLERNLDFSQWLQQLQQRQVEMRRFEYSPLVQVQGWSEVERKRPLFESNLVFENYPADLSSSRQQHELQISELQLVDPPHFPLTVLVAPGPQLNLTIEYSQQRFETTTMLRFLQHFALLLEAITLAPDWSLLDLPLELDDTEPYEPFNTFPAYEQDQFVFELS